MGVTLVGQIGTIYFVACKERYVKIGFVWRRSVSKRIDDMQGENPFQLKLIRIITPAYMEQERWLHQHFEHLKASTPAGEWFCFSDEMLTINPPDSETCLANKAALEKQLKLRRARMAYARAHPVRQWRTPLKV
jgi:hypothetical protein